MRFFVKNQPIPLYETGPLFPVCDRKHKNEEVAYSGDFSIAKRIADMLNRDAKSGFPHEISVKCGHNALQRSYARWLRKI